MFGNKTSVRLRSQIELRRLRKKLGHLTIDGKDEICLLSYRSGPEEPSPEKSYNFSRDGLLTRSSDGRRGQGLCSGRPGNTTDGIRLVRRPAEGTLCHEQKMRSRYTIR